MRRATHMPMTHQVPTRVTKDDFADVCGYDEAKRELAQIADVLRNHDLYQAAGASIPSGLLLVGEPSLGKTLMATGLIRASGLPHGVMRKGANAGATSKVLREVFATAAAETPSIVLLDDMDKLSNSDYDLCDTEEYVTVQACMDEHRGKGIFVVATVNDERKLPGSLKREGRFDRVIRLSPPSGGDVQEIVAHYLATKSCGLGVSVRDVADMMEGHSCAFLETVVNEASLAATYERSHILELRHFVAAYARTEGQAPLSPLDTTIDAPTFCEAGATERAQVAMHEAGHIVCLESYRPGATAAAFVVGKPGKLEGVTRTRDLAGSGTYDGTWEEVCVSLAGSVAVEQRFGVPGNGCSRDFSRAFSSVRSLMKDAALSGAYYTCWDSYETSSELDSATEQAAAVLLERARWEVRELLANRRQELEQLAEKLYERAYLLSSDVEHVMRLGELPADVRSFAAE